MATETKTATGRAPEALVETRDADEFAALLKKSFKPRTERAATELENAVSTLVGQALSDANLVKADVIDTLEEMIAQLDKSLSADERDHPCAGVSTNRKCVARAQLSGDPFRDRRDA